MPSTLKGRRAVVAGRDRLWREDAEDMLLDRSCEVETCREPGELVRLVDAGPVDLLVVDGPSAAEMLAALDGRELPFVLVLDEGDAVRPQLDGFSTGGARVVLPAAPYSAVALGQLRSWFESPDDASELDLAVLKDLGGTFGAALAGVLDVFVEDAPVRADRLAASVAAADWEAARRDAHSLKSSTATFGLMILAADIAAFEAACRVGRGPDEAHRMAGVADRIREGITEVQRAVAELG